MNEENSGRNAIIVVLAVVAACAIAMALWIMYSGQPAQASALTKVTNGTFKAQHLPIYVISDSGIRYGLEGGESRWGVTRVAVQYGTCVKIDNAAPVCNSGGGAFVNLPPLKVGTHVVARTR